MRCRREVRIFQKIRTRNRAVLRHTGAFAPETLVRQARARRRGNRQGAAPGRERLCYFHHRRGIRPRQQTTTENRWAWMCAWMASCFASATRRAGTSPIGTRSRPPPGGPKPPPDGPKPKTSGRPRARPPKPAPNGQPPPVRPPRRALRSWRLRCDVRGVAIRRERSSTVKSRSSSRLSLGIWARTPASSRANGGSPTTDRVEIAQHRHSRPAIVAG